MYGFMMQREKIMAALLSCYMGMVVVSVWAAPIQEFFAGKKTIANTWIASDASPSTIKIVLFLLIVVLVASKADISIGRESSFAPLEIILYAIITGILISATVFGYLPAATQMNIVAQTHFVHYLKDFYTIWLLAPIVLIVFVASRKRG